MLTNAFQTYMRNASVLFQSRQILKKEPAILTMSNQTKIIDKTNDSLAAQTIQLFISEISLLANIQLQTANDAQKRIV